MALVYYQPSNWLRSSLHSGYLNAGQSAQAIITFNATDLTQGVYTGHLDLNSNDPDQNSVDIPITFTIGGQGAPDISFSPVSITDTLNEGQTSDFGIVIHNRGNANLIVNLSATEYNLAAGNNDGSSPLSISKLTRPSDTAETPSDILNTWLFISPSADTISPGDSLIAQATLDSRFIGADTYLGQIVINSNDPDSPTGTIPVVFLVYAIGPGCSYTIGDINGNGTANGIDVVYGVSYFKGGALPPVSCDCPGHGPLFVAGDVNANCIFNGIDITFYVGYLKGSQPALRACPDCLPGMLSSPGSAIGIGR
jgi:hypothetical protein